MSILFAKQKRNNEGAQSLFTNASLSRRRFFFRLNENRIKQTYFVMKKTLLISFIGPFLFILGKTKCSMEMDGLKIRSIRSRREREEMIDIRCSINSTSDRIVAFVEYHLQVYLVHEIHRNFLESYHFHPVERRFPFSRQTILFFKLNFPHTNLCFIIRQGDLYGYSIRCLISTPEYPKNNSRY